MHKFWLSFVPMFVAVDAIGMLPMFISLTEGLDKKQVRRVIIQSVATAIIVSLLFLIIGKSIFKFLGITISDFMIAGGLLLFAISLGDLLTIEKKQRYFDVETLGAVPIAVPLMVGPAVLTTMILIVDEYGVFPTVLSLVLNILIAGLVFWGSHIIISLLGNAGVKIISKLASLILAAFSIMFVRKGIEMLLNSSL